MRLHKAEYQHLLRAAHFMAPSDREEMDRVCPGRSPVSVLTAALDETTVAITDRFHNVMAVGGSAHGFVWFTHTDWAEALQVSDRVKVLKLIKSHLKSIQEKAHASGGYLTNVVSLENTKHLRLLRGLGARFADDVISHNGHDFKQFYF